MSHTDQPELFRASATFVQPGNTCGTTADSEAIEIAFEFQAGEDEGPFFVIKTEGWSFDDLAEVEQLIQRVSRILRHKELTP